MFTRRKLSIISTAAICGEMKLFLEMVFENLLLSYSSLTHKCHQNYWRSWLEPSVLEL